MNCGECVREYLFRAEEMRKIRSRKACPALEEGSTGITFAAFLNWAEVSFKRGVGDIHPPVPCIERTVSRLPCRSDTVKQVTAILHGIKEVTRLSDAE